MTHEHNFAPLAWHVADAVTKSHRHADPLVLRVMIPNLALLFMCLTGSLLGDRSSGGFFIGLVACSAVAMTVGAMSLSRARLGVGPELHVADPEG